MNLSPHARRPLSPHAPPPPAAGDLAARLRSPYRLALAAPAAAALGGLLITLARAAEQPVTTAPLSDDLYALLSAGGVGCAFIATLLSRALLSPARVGEAEDPVGHVWTSCVLTWGVCALGALTGLALCLWTGQLGDLAPAVTLSLLTTLAHPPAEPRLRAALGGRR